MRTKKSTQAERAYHTIKQAILRGEIEEGRFLSGEEIGNRYNIGRTPFREACNRLHNEMILEVVARRGYFVPQLSFRSFGDLFEVRLVIEGAIAEIAAQRATPAQIAELEGITKKFSSSESADPEQAIKLNTEFHLCLAHMTQNNELIELEKRILERTERLNYIEYRRYGIGKQLAVKLHEPVLNAIRSGSPALARQSIIHDITQAQIRTAASGLPEDGRGSGHEGIPNINHSSTLKSPKKPGEGRRR